ncbi:MAG: hypothetical protein ACRD8U_19710, partial [Pyrinomonadaceae bacterium]
MKKLARIVTLALLLNLTLSAQVPLFGQTARSGKSASQTAGQYRDAIKIFEEFTRKHMSLDKTVGLTIGFVKDDFVWVNGYGYAD